MSVRFFRHDHSLYMFDPDTFQVYRFDSGRWVLSEDAMLREEIRFRSVEVSCAEALPVLHQVLHFGAEGMGVEQPARDLGAEDCLV
jgi:hypothetical protein